MLTASRDGQECVRKCLKVNIISSDEIKSDTYCPGTFDTSHKEEEFFIYNLLVRIHFTKVSRMCTSVGSEFPPPRKIFRNLKLFNNRILPDCPDTYS